MITFSSRRATNGVLSDSTGPRLLVSVRSCDEAIKAFEGGAEILDVKEPDHGSLGMADLPVIQAIADHVRDASGEIPLSIALGELQAWMRGSGNDIPSIPDAVRFAKLGLSHLADVSDWSAVWQRIRSRFDERRSAPLKWVAVAYADDGAAKSPALDEIITAATTTGCAGLLIDTFTKSGKTLVDYLSVSKLRETVDRCHASGIFLAIAGSLTIEALQELNEVKADIIAIRSAACRNANRRAAIDAPLVAAFRAGMQRNLRR